MMASQPSSKMSPLCRIMCLNFGMVLQPINLILGPCQEEIGSHNVSQAYFLWGVWGTDLCLTLLLALLSFFLQYFDVLDPSSFTGKLDATLGPHWDIYLMSLLIGLVILLLIWRRGH